MKRLLSAHKVIASHFQPKEFAKTINGLSIIEANVAGNGTIIRDDITGLEWLNLRACAGKSFDQIRSLCKNGNALSGWRYASLPESQQLYSRFGFDLYATAYPKLTNTIRESIELINSYLGETINWSGAFTETQHSGTMALTGTRNSNNNIVTLPVFYKQDSENSTIDTHGGFSIGSQYSAPFLSSLLIRNPLRCH